MAGGETTTAIEVLGTIGAATYVYRDQIRGGLQQLARFLAEIRLSDGENTYDPEEHSRELAEFGSYTVQPDPPTPEPQKGPKWGKSLKEKLAYISYNLVRLFRAGQDQGFWTVVAPVTGDPWLEIPDRNEKK